MCGTNVQVEMNKKNPEVVVLSDMHLGTYGCHAKEILQYLQSIKPKILVLNGDIIDIWSFNKKYFPTAHSEIIRKLLKMASQGVMIYYIPGNHDEALRKYIGFRLGKIKVVEKLILELDGKKHWIFHGDVFDATTKGSAKIIAKLGGKGYDLLILLNRWINHLLIFMGREKMSFSKKVKNGVKKAVSWINNFESTAIELALEQKYEYVICGHIHQPQMRTVEKDGLTTTYLNSGDWIENLTALEYENKIWSIYHYDKSEYLRFDPSVQDTMPTIPIESMVAPVRVLA